ncbi:MAG: hypothetical protein ABI171_18445, partial [Collimonas sp.]
STPTKVLVHGLIGGLMAKAIGGNFGTGAAGAAAAKLAVETFGNDIQGIAGLSADEKNALVQLVGLTVGKAVAQAAGGTAADGNAAAVTAKLATQYNFLNHTQAALMRKDIASCQAKAGGCTDDQVMTIFNKYHDLSNANISAVQSCITAGDAQCVKNLESSAATASEVSGILPFGYGNYEKQLIARQNNVNDFGSVAGKDAAYGTDIQQAQDIAKFRAANCSGQTSSACDTLVAQAIGYRLARAGLLSGAAAATAVLTTGVRNQLPGPKTAAIGEVVPEKNIVVGDGDLHNVYGINTGTGTTGKLIGSTNGRTLAEQNFVGEMLGGGKTVEIIPATNAGRSADFVIDGRKYELKTMSDVTNQTSDGLSKALSSTAMDARGQSGDIIIDARNQSGMTADIAARGIDRAYGADSRSGSKIQSITVVTPQGTVYVPRKL